MIFYALNVALILAGCFLFYKGLLQKETFFPLNRYVLLCCLALSFGLPLIPVPQQWSLRNPKTESIRTVFQVRETSSLPNASNVSSGQTAQQVPTTNTTIQGQSFFKDISILKVLMYAYWLGVIVFGLNFLFQLCLLLYKSFTSPSIQDGRFKIIELSNDKAPCSFGNSIFINPEKYDWDTYNQIILHEKIHIQQGHSYDIILAELALIFQWFNPFAWFYRKAMEDNLEFLTDSEVLTHADVEKTSYQMSLVKVSSPNFPISLTTNYNQSILKKRLIMMNAKKSSLNSTWKYLCIVPLLLLFVSLLNEPLAYGNAKRKTENATGQFVATNGNWFATIKGNKVKIRFEEDGNQNSNSNTEFDRSEFKDLPNTMGTFSLKREAGTIQFTGRFEGNTGMGTYKFNADKDFITFLEKENIRVDEDKDMIVYYMVNLKKDFVKMLKTQGYTNLSKHDLIPLAALNISAEYIASLKNTGLTELTVQNLIAFKALDIDAQFVNEIKNSGFKDFRASKIIPLKAQGIDGATLKAAREAKEDSHAHTNSKTNKEDDEDDVLGSLIAKKALNITPEYVKSFKDAGYKFSDEELISMKALGITAAYCKSFDAVIPNLQHENYISLKALSFTKEEYAEYMKLGFKNLEMDDVFGAKATGVTPAFINDMRKKGHNYTSMDKYIQMKVLALGGD